MSNDEDLEKQIEDVDRKRREVNSRLNELDSGREGTGTEGRSFSEQRPRDSAMRSDERPERPRRGVDVRPPRELGGESIVSPTGTKRASSVQLDDKEKKRSKRLFGSLVMGTLARTRKDLDASAATATGKKRAEQEAKIAAKVAAEREASREQRRKEFLKRKEEESKQRAQHHKEMAVKEFEMLTERWETHRTQLCSFLRTKTEPAIFYRPAKALEGMEAILEKQLAEMEEEAQVHLESARDRYLRQPEAKEQGAAPEEEEKKSEEEKAQDKPDKPDKPDKSDNEEEEAQDSGED